MRRLSSLARLRGARLAYPSSTPTIPLDLDIPPATQGGHALLGANGCGKSLVAEAFLDNDAVVAGGSVERAPRSARVSFEAHGALVDEGLTVYEACGKLQTKASKYLVVRFGLHPLLWRPVGSVSTGEIRKVLLARALARKPDLLLLDNAYDGLDAPSRAALAKLLSQMLTGFSALLVQDVPHRAEEVLPEVARVSWLGVDGVATAPTPPELAAALGAFCAASTAAPPESVAAAVYAGAPSSSSNAAVVEARGLGVRAGDVRVLRDVDWTVRRGEHWLVAGGNGSGKSTLGALLARPLAARDWFPTGRSGDLAGSLEVLGVDVARGGAAAVAWVSTELHLALAARADAASVVARCFGATAGAAAYVLEAGFGVGAAALDRPFRALSQGEQKLVLVAGAVAAKPELLVLDEVCQGLDATHRARVLALADAVAPHASIVFISHHRDEILPCVTHVLDLAQNEAPTFVGEMRAWTPP
ncbi:ABC transporter [Aureococcus anophagefferens]|uniref:ABC transporter n=1 Tax=Aureococcus anophagefferens TaxID=44056 RepID=A0ABR1GAZ4_AURAN